jgi:hypothetical protein
MNKFEKNISPSPGHFFTEGANIIILKPFISLRPQ